MVVAREREMSRGLGRVALALVVLALGVWFVFACVAVRDVTHVPEDVQLGAEAAAPEVTTAAGVDARASSGAGDRTMSGLADVAPEAEPSGVPLTGESALEASLPADVPGFATDGFFPGSAPDGVQAYRAEFVPVVAAAKDEPVHVEVSTWPTSTAALSAGDDAMRSVVDQGGKVRKVPRGLPEDARRADVDGQATVVWTRFTTTFVVVGTPGQAASLARELDLG